jgi:hypothetical protein
MLDPSTLHADKYVAPDCVDITKLMSLESSMVEELIALGGEAEVLARKLAAIKVSRDRLVFRVVEKNRILLFETDILTERVEAAEENVAELWAKVSR